VDAHLHLVLHFASRSAAVRPLRLSHPPGHQRLRDDGPGVL